MKAKQIVASYLILQAVGTEAWWGLLLLVPNSIRWFDPEAWPPEFIWHLFVRPLEEADLRERFGESYSRYRESVRLWLPKLRSMNPR